MHAKSTSDDYGAGHSSSPYFYRLTTAEVAQILRTDPEAGLTAAEAQRRLAVDGPNALTEKKTSNLMRF
ncbi:cation-transporting P-type ATPase [Pediococcus acidilactici]